MDEQKIYVRAVSKGKREQVVCDACALILGRMQKATPEQTVSLSQELFRWYKELIGIG